MRRICEEAEAVIDYNSLFHRIRIGTSTGRYLDVPESVCSSAVKAAMDVNAKLIVALTETGHTARLIAKYRPSQQVLALSASEATTKHLQIVRGVIALQVPSFQGTDHVIRSALDKAKALGLIVPGDKVVAVHGVQEELSGHSNLMKVLDVI
jgi:pyruvate kinase